VGKERDAMEDKLTLSVEETAKLLGIGRNLCYERVKTGEIPVIKIGRRLLVPRSALEKLLADPKPLNLTPASK
jgi:excisionase family DNA binding protein